MTDEEIQKLLAKNERTTSPEWLVPQFSRPITLMVAFLTSTTLARVIYSTIFGYGFRMSTGLNWIRNIEVDFRYNLHIAVVFWLCFRAGKLMKAIYVIPIVFLFFSIEWELLFQPWMNEHQWFVTWGQVYRLLMIAIVFRIAHLGFRLSLQPIGSLNESSQLRLSTLLVSTALFAGLVGGDMRFRQWMVEHGVQRLVMDPPLLAFVSATTRSLLWIGLALILARGKRKTMKLGLAMLCLWIVSRSMVVYYLDSIYFPDMGKLYNRPMERMSLEELVVLQFVQLCVAWCAAMLFVWTGYRFCTTQTDCAPASHEAIGFDAIN